MANSAIKIKLSILSIALSCLVMVKANAQATDNLVEPVKSAGLQQLRVGDQLPDFAVGKVLNTTGNVQTADFKDRLLIIDLWATSCSACIAAMPRLDSLQKQFGNSIKVLPVTREPEAQMKTFWQNNRHSKNLSINTVVEDRTFLAYFPHRYISHDVWVYKGKVIAITGVEQVTAANIQKVLNGEQVKLPLKDDFGTPRFNGAVKSLKDDGAAAIGSGLMKYAVIKPFMEGVKSSSIVNQDAGGIVRDTATKSVRAYIINEGIYTSYLWALLSAKGMNWMEMVNTIYGGFDPNKVVWEVADKSKYFYQKSSGDYDQWKRKYAICFESLTSDTAQSDQQVYTSIARDLDDILGLEVKFEKRKIKTLILTKVSTDDKLKTKNAGIDESYHAAQEGPVFRMRDSRLGLFVKTFNEHTENPYMIDETKYASNADLDLNIPNWTDVPAVRKELQKYGLGLKEEERVIEVLVFTETGGGLKLKSSK